MDIAYILDSGFFAELGKTIRTLRVNGWFVLRPCPHDDDYKMIGHWFKRQ